MSVGRSAGPHPAGAPVARVRNLTVAFGDNTVVSDVSFDVEPGRCLALVGESGSGKSVTARSLLGLAGAGASVHADELGIAGSSVLGLSERAWRRRRGRDVGLVLQDALVSLDPLRPVGREVADSLRLHTPLGAAARQARVRELLAAVGLPDAGQRMRQRSGELSGGQRQRALIAAAIALDPPLLIADEPTTALDVTVQAQVLELLESLKKAGTGILLISHDLAVVSRVADDIAVMSAGRIVETGPTAQLLSAPTHPITRRMLAAIPAGVPRGATLALPHPVRSPLADARNGSRGRDGAMIPTTATDSRAGASEEARAEARWDARQRASEVVLEARGLSKEFRRPDGTRQLAVDNVSFALHRGTTLGIVGESGSGKTTTARLVLALTTPDAGEVRLLGQPFTGIPEGERRTLRPAIGAVYQDALGSFDPRFTVREILHDAVTGGRPRSPASAAAPARVAELVDAVALPQTLLERRPLALSGGQRQRVSIARALAARPDVLVCDEPVSALDVTVQAQVLDLLDELQRELGLSLLFISHDLGVVQHMSDTVAVMQNGCIVETGDAASVFEAPAHPYTRQLLNAVPLLPAGPARPA